MHMVLAHMPTQERYVSGFACLTDQLPGTQRNLTCQYVIAVLRYPHEVVLDVVDCMWPLAVAASGFEDEAGLPLSLCRLLR
jgi:hypothetical protein